MIKLISSILDSLNKNIGLITLFVGGVAIYLYLKQKRDYKRDAAKLILQEIRYAEQQIRIAKDHGYIYYLASKILPTNSWNQNIHLFIKDLKETDMDLISRFYGAANYLDKLIGIISDRKSTRVERTIERRVPTPAPILIPEQSTHLPVSQNLPGIEQVIIKESLLAEKILKDVSSKVEFIYNTPAVDKLRQISEKKWYQLF